MTIADMAHNMKRQSTLLAASGIVKRNNALRMIAHALEDNKDIIFDANKRDIKYAVDNDIPQSVIKRLKYDESKLQDTINGLRGLIDLDDPIGKILMRRELDTDLLLTKITVPIGVIGVIFEARPDALVQVASLCIKSGNCAILKGGKETSNTNKVLFDIIKEAAVKAGLPDACLYQAKSHSEIDELLDCDRDIDLIIPRGSNRLVRYIMDHTKIPVMGHSSGVCHIYVDDTADIDTALNVIIDAKKQYPAACNALETVLISRTIADTFIPSLYEALVNNDIKVNGTDEVSKIIGRDITIIDDDAFYTEYGDLEISLKIVDGIDEAIEHINRYGSHHTDAIMTTDADASDLFTRMVDSAGVYVNASTRFADGYRYGFGAEVGISTGKLHARGPVGLDSLMTYKYKLIGDGNIVSDYASGKRTFKHRDL